MPSSGIVQSEVPPHTHDVQQSLVTTKAYNNNVNGMIGKMKGNMDNYATDGRMTGH